jgi:acyl-coenzyme A thioesterase PaaI-like protein
MSDFVAATGVDRRAGGSDSAEFTADLDPQWSARDVLQGGYLVAVLGRAGLEVADQPHLTSANAIFVRAPQPGPATVRIDVLRSGRSTTHLRGRLIQDDEMTVEAHLILTTLGDDDPWWSRHEDVPQTDPDDCPVIPAEPPGVGFRVAMLEVVEERLDPQVLGFTAGQPSGRGRVAGYLRLRDGSDWDPLSLQVALDMGPPAHFDLGMGGGAPTLQLTTYVRRLPAPGPVWIELRADDVGDNRMTEQMRVWDSKRRLVGQATQLAAVRLPDGPPPGPNGGLRSR